MAFRIAAADGTVANVAGHKVDAVVLKKEIQNGVKVRPTNTTAVLTVEVTGVSYDVIVLHNGPKGGFSQSFEVPSGATVTANSVIEAVITDE